MGSAVVASESADAQSLRHLVIEDPDAQIHSVTPQLVFESLHSSAGGGQGARLPECTNAWMTTWRQVTAAAPVRHDAPPQRRRQLQVP